MVSSHVRSLRILTVTGTDRFSCSLRTMAQIVSVSSSKNAP